MLIKVSDLAKRWGVNRVTVWRWSHRPNFPKSIKLGEASPRWRVADIEAYEALQTE